MSEDQADNKSINDRINPYGKNPHNPVLRYRRGDCESIRLESGLYDADEGMQTIDYQDPYAIWGYDANLDEPISDSDFEAACSPWINKS